MSTWALGVLGSLAAALVVAVTGLALRTWRRLGLRWLALRRRRGVRRGLAAHLGFERSGLRGPLSRREVESLAASFRLKDASSYEMSRPGTATFDARTLVAHVARRDSRIFLVNAESGYGKTALGMALSLLPAQERFVPLYVDLSEAGAEASNIEEMLPSLGGVRGGRLSGRPLFVIDALNEAVDPIDFCNRLAARDRELRRMEAKFLFLFSFRHRSYPSQLRAALFRQGLGPLEHLELLFDLESDGDLSFFPLLAQAHGVKASGTAELLGELRAYGAGLPAHSLSRSDLRAYLEWRRVTRGGGGIPPAPSALRFATLIAAKAKRSGGLHRLAEVAFGLLSEERTATAYGEVPASHPVSQRRAQEWVAESGLEGLVRPGEHHLHFQDESTVRMLGALHIARVLGASGSPDMLRGRNAYDVCAPYLQSALRWELESRADAATVETVADRIALALSGRDAPYSFYAGVLCSDVTGLLGDHRESLDAHLFEQMIVAIDEDRVQTCRESLEAAGRSEPQPTLDPVLDQLFEVMGAYGGRAVDLLLRTMGDRQPLVRSQAAYLLLDCVGNASGEDDELLAAIAARMPSKEPNLHVRFHQVEVLEALGERFREGSEGRRAVRAALAELVEARLEVAGGGVETVYRECQQLVGMRASLAAAWSAREDEQRRMGELVRRCMGLIEGDPAFRRMGRDADTEARLECWEVTLGFAVHMCDLLHRNSAFISFVEGALEHRFWIVRWWAFGGLIRVTERAGGRGDRVLAGRCARRAAERLAGGIEPMGLKHRQCALVERVLSSDNLEASQAMREAMAGIADVHLTPAARQAFSESYYEALGASPDAYLSEFFRRLEKVTPVPHAGEGRER